MVSERKREAAYVASLLFATPLILLEGRKANVVKAALGAGP
jgi:hypothetical protein